LPRSFWAIAFKLRAEPSMKGWSPGSAADDSSPTAHMKIEQRLFSARAGWNAPVGNLDGLHPQFALVFAGRSLLENPAVLDELRSIHGGTRLIIASTSGEITDTAVSEDTLNVTAVALEKTRIACATVMVRSQFESRAAGQELAARLNGPGLVHVFVVSDGQLVNGTELSRGFNEHLTPGVTLTGGLAGDGARFEKTLVGLDDKPCSGRIVALAFYGQNLRVGFGSSGGWKPVGTTRIATRSSGNILFELDGQPALRLYKEYLGDQAAALPASALRFPLCVTTPDGRVSVVRTILSVEELTQSMLFAGDIPTGSHISFMCASHSDLVQGAAQAAEQSRQAAPVDLAICVSCVGRRLVLGERTQDETERVRQILGPHPAVTGFYSYGELAPWGQSGCQLHNQTMTITTLRED
jgi:hypothetical protein